MSAESTLAGLAHAVPVVPADTPLARVDEIARAHPGLRDLVVSDGSRLGLLSIRSFRSVWEETAGQPAAARRLVRDLADWSPIRMRADTSLRDASQRVRALGHDQRYEDVLVELDDGEIGVLATAQLFDALARDLADRAGYDELTGLRNRAHFITRLMAACVDANVGGPRVTVSFIDLDRLKPINDTFGHAVGDAVLVSVARRLARAAGSGDLVARIGGDEFAVLGRLDRDAPAEARAAAFGQGHRAAVVATDADQAPGTYTSASVGVAVSGEIADARALLAEADRAMYRVKQAGGNDTAVRVGVEPRLGAGPRTAAGPADERRVLYQPIARIADGAVNTVEALVRGRPAVVPPGPGWLDRPADSRLLEVDRWALRTACADLLAMDGELGARAPETVNVSLSLSALAGPVNEIVLGVLDETGLPPHRLRLQVPAYAELDLLGGAVPRLTLLSEHGVELALDDIGAGSTCLQAMSMVNVHRVRLDAALVSGMLDNPRDRDVVGVLTVLARALGFEVTAKGVDTPEQFDAVADLGVDYAQGDHVGVPQSLRSLVHLLGGGAPRVARTR